MDLSVVEVLIWAAVFYFFYKLGQWSVLWPIKLAVRHMAERRGMDTEQFLRDELRDMVPETDSPEPTQRRLNIERHEGHYYAYENGQFIAQGTDFRTLFETIKQQFPGKTFTVDQYSAGFTEEEAGRLVRSIFEVYGDKNGESTKDRQ